MHAHQNKRQGRDKQQWKWLPYAGTTQIRFKEYFSVTGGDTSSKLDYALHIDDGRFRTKCLGHAGWEPGLDRVHAQLPKGIGSALKAWTRAGGQQHHGDW